MDFLVTIHPWLGYLVAVAVVAAAVAVFGSAKAGDPFQPRLAVVALVLLDIQVLLGGVIYVGTSAWEASAAIAWIHPGLMVAALGVGHGFLARARREQMVADAYRMTGRGLVAALVLVAAGIGIASAV